MSKFDSFHVDQLGVVIAPEGALGGDGVLACLERNIPLIVVSNPNILNVTSRSLGIKENGLNTKNKVLHAASYVEAAGLILLLKEGINPESLCRPISNVREVK